jgi:biopolymer transport protein ExbB/TolQ
MIEIIFIAILSIFLIVLSALFFRQRLISKALAERLIQAFIDNDQIAEKIEAKHLSKDIEKTEGFVQFLSESRDWAFQYIETVQEALNKFVKDAGPRLEYFDKSGRVVNSPHFDLLEDILVAYRELQQLLPEQDNKEKNE